MLKRAIPTRTETAEAQKKLDPKTSREKNEREGVQQRFLEDCSIRAIEGKGNERKFQLSFSSEAAYERWWGTEILSHKGGALNLDRINQIGCVLFNHDRNVVIGKVNRAWLEDSRGLAEIEFDKDEESEKIYQKVLCGTLKGVSVGYVVDEWEDVRQNQTSSDGRFHGPCSIATRWTPMEISIVSVPADPTVGVGRSREAENEGVGSLYFCERQLQINHNLIKEVQQL